VSAARPGWRQGLVASLVLGVALRVYDLGGESFWGDELAMALATGRGWDAVREELLRGRAPVFPVLGHLWLQAFGTSEAAARSLSALAGIASLPLLFAVGRRLVDAPTAVLAVLLMAVSGFQIAYAQEYRYYALVVALTLLASLLYLRALAAERGADLSAWAVAGAALFHTHPYGLLVVAAQDAHFLLAARARAPLRRGFALAHLLLAALVLPGLLVRQAGTHAGHQRLPSWIEAPAPWQPALTFGHFLLPQGTPPLAAVSLAALLGGSALLALRRGPLAATGLTRDGARLLALWLALPLLVPLLASWLFAPVYVDRYVIAASPPAYLLVAAGLRAIRQTAPLRLTVAGFLLACAPGLFSYYARPQKEQWREAAGFLRATAADGDVVVFVEPGQRPQSRALAWYGTGSARACSVDREAADAGRLFSAFAACLPRAGRAFVFERAPATVQQGFRSQWIDGPHPVLRRRDERRFQGIRILEVERLPARGP
jgi:4-amino-4-deoxy-L-arabinose transferase-like glycosyltransferase